MDWQRFKELIDEQLDVLKRHGDRMVDSLVEGSQPDEDDNEGEIETSPTTCKGLCNLKVGKAVLLCCSDPANPSLWTCHHHDSNRLLYFCKGSHLVRYFFTKFNKRGAKVGKEPAAKKQKMGNTGLVQLCFFLLFSERMW